MIAKLRLSPVFIKSPKALGFALVVLLGLGSFAHAKSINIQQMQVKTDFKKKSARLQLLRGKKLLSTQRIKTDLNPKLVSLKKVTRQGKEYLLIDYSRGVTFGTRHETECYEVALYSVEKKKLKLRQKVKYKCDVNSSDEVYLAKDFFHPWKLDKAKAEIKFIFAPK